MTRALALLAAAVALMAPAAAIAKQSDPPALATLAVIGDTPYGPAQVPNFPNDMSNINADPAVTRVIHLGDIKDGSSVCSDEYFSYIRGNFDNFADPLVYTPARRSTRRISPASWCRARRTARTPTCGSGSTPRVPRSSTGRTSSCRSMQRAIRPRRSRAASSPVAAEKQIRRRA
jgi:hypothetical protein